MTHDAVVKTRLSRLWQFVRRQARFAGRVAFASVVVFLTFVGIWLVVIALANLGWWFPPE